jgi:large subunit ribosomal protein L13
MKVIDGKGIVLGRIASYAAKESLKGEEIAIVNCNEVIITGNKESIKKDFNIRRSRIGSSQKGPKLPKSPEKIVKRAIRGMLPEHRWGRGRIAFKKIKCYNKIPLELEKEKLITLEQKEKIKSSKIKEFG